MKKRQINIFIIAMTVILLTPIFIIQAKTSNNARVIKKNITLEVGSKKKLSVKMLKLSNKESKKIKWKSNNKKIATVSKKGVVKTKKVGKAKITARYSDKKVQYIIKVNNKKEIIPAQTITPPVNTIVPSPQPTPKYTQRPKSEPATPSPIPEEFFDWYYNREPVQPGLILLSFNENAGVDVYELLKDFEVESIKEVTTAKTYKYEVTLVDKYSLYETIVALYKNPLVYYADVRRTVELQGPAVEP